MTGNAVYIRQQSAGGRQSCNANDPAYSNILVNTCDMLPITGRPLQFPFTQKDAEYTV